MELYWPESGLVPIVDDFRSLWVQLSTLCNWVHNQLDQDRIVYLFLIRRICYAIHLERFTINIEAKLIASSNLSGLYLSVQNI